MAEQAADYSPEVPGSAAHAAPANRALTGGSFDDLVNVMVAHLKNRDVLATLDADQVRQRLTGLRRLEGATTAAIATAVAALDRAGGVGADGAPSTAEWLKANTGRSGRQAAQMARLARDLDDLPATADALADGRIGADAADTIVKATRDGRLGTPDEVEAELLPVATTAPPEQLHRHVRTRQQQADGAAMLRDEQRQRAQRRLSLVQRHSGGMWELHGAVTNEVGTKLRTALDAFDHPDSRVRAAARGASGTAGTDGSGGGTPGADPDAPAATADGSIGTGRRPDQRLADALEALTDQVLDAGLAPGTGGIARPHISVIVDLATIDTNLTNDAGDGPVSPHDPAWAGLAPGETAWGTLLSPQVVHRLLCDAAVSRIVTAGPSQVLDVGQATRDWSEPQRRAVNARDRGCRGPNCTLPIAWTHIHHLQWWRHDGPTSVDNGLALCHHCHHLVHDRDWTVTHDLTTATATWTSPTGTVTTTTPHRLEPSLPTIPRHGPGTARHRPDRTPRTGSDRDSSDGRGSGNVGSTDAEPGDVHGTRASSDGGMPEAITLFDQPAPTPRPSKRP